jgi:predicted O-methyltransferase YrrM
MTDLAQVLQTIDEAYAAGSIPDETGKARSLHPAAVYPEQGAALRELVTREKAARTFEVGFALGLSTLHICAGLLEGGAPDPQHVAVDPTETWLWANAGTQLVATAGLSDIVEVVEQESQAVLPVWMAERRLFDIAFIDGDHRYDPCFLDIYYALRLVRNGGLILVDDMWMPSVRTAVAFFERNIDGLTLETEAIPTAFRWNARRPWQKVRTGTGNTAVLRKPLEHVERDGEHFVPFW